MTTHTYDDIARDALDGDPGIDIRDRVVLSSCVHVRALRAIAGAYGLPRGGGKGTLADRILDHVERVEAAERADRLAGEQCVACGGPLDEGDGLACDSCETDLTDDDATAIALGAPPIGAIDAGALTDEDRAILRARPGMARQDVLAGLASDRMAHRVLAAAMATRSSVAAHVTARVEIFATVKPGADDAEAVY